MSGAISTITPVELEGLRKSGRNLFLIDVRTPEEYEEVHATQAKLFVLQTLNPEEVRAAHQASGAEETIYVICRSGARSLQACNILSQAGMKTVNVSGGTLEWMAQGLPTERG